MQLNEKSTPVIIGGLRSPFGKHCGALSTVRPDDLAGDIIRQLVEKYYISPDMIEDVILGCANQAGEDSRNVARNAILASGLSENIPGITVNRLCASGLAAVVDAARAVMSSEGELFIAGGVESMTRAPFVMSKADSAFSRELKTFDTTIGARFPNPKVLKNFGAHSMPETGDEVARLMNISRSEADLFAESSQQKYAQAKQRAFYNDEMAPVALPQKKGESTPSIFAADEYPRPDTNLEKLSKLNALFPNGVVTAGNASGINDGAAALLIGNMAAANKIGCKPIGIIRGSASYGIAPKIMGLGPVEAARRLLKRLNLTLSDMDVIEINEAFASQVLACLKQLEIPFTDSRVNPNGGAIALGHPLGASGARLALTAARNLQETQGRYALVSLCVGMGQGLAMVIERC